LRQRDGLTAAVPRRYSPRPMRTTMFLLPALVVTIACGQDKPAEAKLPPIGDALPSIMVPRQSSLVSYSGSEDALSLLYRTAVPMDEAAEFYRRRLSAGPWHLVSDAKDNEDAIVLHATQDGPPLWVRIWPDSEFNATFVQLSGAVRKLDSTATATETTPPAPDSAKPAD